MNHGDRSECPPDSSFHRVYGERVKFSASASVSVNYFGDSGSPECLAKDGAKRELEKIHQWCIRRVRSFRIGVASPILLRPCATTSVGPPFFFFPRISQLPSRLLPEVDQLPFQFRLDGIALTRKRLNPNPVFEEP